MGKMTVWTVRSFHVFFKSAPNRVFHHRNIVVLEKMYYVSSTWPILYGQNDRMDREIISCVHRNVPQTMYFTIRINLFKGTPNFQISYLLN